MSTSLDFLRAAISLYNQDIKGLQGTSPRVNFCQSQAGEDCID